MTEELNVSTEPIDDGSVIISLSGRFMAGDAESVKDIFIRVVNGQEMDVVVDMAEVPFIDSAGLSALVSGLKHVRGSGGNMVLAAVQPQTLTVFTLTMLDQVFTIYPDRQTALAQIAEI